MGGIIKNVGEGEGFEGRKRGFRKLQGHTAFLCYVLTNFNGVRRTGYFNY